MTQPLRTTARRRARAQEGAAMLVVMLILLAATVGATFAVHATTTELRSAGYMRQALQTEYIGEAGAVAALDYVTRIGPQGLLYVMNRTMTLGMSNPYMEFGEPMPAAGKNVYRLVCDPGNPGGANNDFVSPIGGVPGGSPLDPASLGTRSNRTPRFVADINDHYTYQLPTAGARADGRGNMYFIGATITSRGRTAIENVDPAGRPTSTTAPLAAAATQYRRHEASNDARAQLISGPFAM